MHYVWMIEKQSESFIYKHVQLGTLIFSDGHAYNYNIVMNDKNNNYLLKMKNKISLETEQLDSLICLCSIITPNYLSKINKKESDNHRNKLSYTVYFDVEIEVIDGSIDFSQKYTLYEFNLLSNKLPNVNKEVSALIDFVDSLNKTENYMLL